MVERRGVCRGLVGKSETERDHLEDFDVDGRIILRWIYRKWVGGIDWIELVPDRDRWRSLVNAVVSFRVPCNGGIS